MPLLLPRLMRRPLLLAALLVHMSAALASTQFFVNANYADVDPDRDLDFRAAVGPVREFDLDSYADGSRVDSLEAPDFSVDLGLSNDGNALAATSVEIFRGNFAAGGGAYGTVAGGALLNRNAAVHEYIVFDFDPPVEAFGTWCFDDGGEQARFEMTVTETDGSVSTSPLLDGQNGSGYFVEGFLGARSDVGIARVTIRAVDPQYYGFFELDHVQVAASTLSAVALPMPMIASALMALLLTGIRTRLATLAAVRASPYIQDR